MTRHSSEAVELQRLRRALSAYGQPSSKRSVLELLVTAMPLAILWLAMWKALEAGHWAALLLSIPAGGLLLRLFLIQHDCGHGAFFRRRSANDWLGRVLGVFTLTPYDYWRRCHAQHHASTGNLSARGVGDVDTLTLGEFRERSYLGRLLYRVYRHPLVLFGIGPAYLFLLRHRLPIGMMTTGWRPWISPMSTNAAIAVVAGLLVWLMGLQTFLLVHLPITLVAASIGVWLFYIQHQFEHTVWDHGEEWSFHEAALHGSSHYRLPALLRWFTANVGVHHVHHLASRIPFYRLPEVLRTEPVLSQLSRVSLRESLAAVRLVLWDENQRRLISFAEAKRQCAAAGGRIG